MSLICLRCGREIAKAAFVIPATTGRDLAFGPVCARKAGLVSSRKAPAAAPQVEESRPAEPDPNQMELSL